VLNRGRTRLPAREAGRSNVSFRVLEGGKPAVKGAGFPRFGAGKGRDEKGLRGGDSKSFRNGVKGELLQGQKGAKMAALEGRNRLEDTSECGGRSKRQLFGGGGKRTKKRSSHNSATPFSKSRVRLRQRHGEGRRLFEKEVRRWGEIEGAARRGEKIQGGRTLLLRSQ